MEDSLLGIIVALTALGLIVSFTIGVIWGRRAALRKGRARGAKRKGDPPKRLEAGEPSTAPLVYEDQMEIPAALIGARHKEIIERVAPALGSTPVNLLRAALEAGLTGGRLVTDEMLDALEAMTSTDPSPPSKPGPSRPN